VIGGGTGLAAGMKLPIRMTGHMVRGRRHYF
jgi:hypothetical protein